MSSIIALQRRAGAGAALLLLLGLLTGGFAAFAMTGKIPADGHAALASHLNALMGAFWLGGVALSLPLLRYSHSGLRRVVVLTAVCNYANWIITALKAVWRVSGIEHTGEGHNDAIFGLLTLFVVLPSIAAAGLWGYGFLGETPAER